jgi:hypothetical protein
MLAMIKCTTKTTTPTEEFQIEDTGDQYMGTAQGTFAVELCGGATGSDVTGSHVIWSGPDRKSSARKWRHNRKYVLHMPGFSPGFFLAIVVQVPGLLEVTKGQVTLREFPWVCACTTESCPISALVGPFDRKWRYEALPRRDQRSPDPFGVPLGGVRACVIGSALGVFSRTSASYLLFSSPYHYLPLSCHFISAFNNGFHLRYFWICTPTSLSRRIAFFVFIFRDLDVSWFLPLIFVFIQHLNHYFVDLLQFCHS